ncbi:FDLD family class I lanthipeptide [Cytobacillus sp. IB215665]|uniref:FDLD family class I lanthipeptide n=1 Tax=Cytobacillus sp. IB215665 TaxID=3097357 RepID=UPI0039B77378
MNNDIFDLDLQINKGSTKTLAGDTDDCISASTCTCITCNHLCLSIDCETNDCNNTRFSNCGCGTSEIC